MLGFSSGDTTGSAPWLWLCLLKESRGGLYFTWDGSWKYSGVEAAVRHHTPHPRWSGWIFEWPFTEWPFTEDRAEA